MDVMLLTMAVTVGVALTWGWKKLPAKLTDAHQHFRENGTAQIYRKGDGRLIGLGISIPASQCSFTSEATFVLLPPSIRSKAFADIGEYSYRFYVVTRWPSMKTVLVIDEK